MISFWTVCWKLYSISVWIQKRWFLCQKWWKRNAIWQTLSVDCGEQTYRMLWNLGFWLRNRNLIKCCKRNIPLFVKILWWCIVKRAIECSYLILIIVHKNLALTILGKTRKTCLRYVLEGQRLRLVPIPGYCPLPISAKYPRPTNISTHDDKNTTDTRRLTLLSLRSSVCKSGRGGSAKLSSLLFFTCSKSE